MQRRLSFGTDVVRTPGKINMSRPSSTSDNSRLSSGSRQRDCQLGQLHTAYFGLCKKVQAQAALGCLHLWPHTWQSLVRLHLFMLCSPSLPQEEACHAWHVNNMSISNQTCNAPLRCGPQPFVPNLNFDEGISRSSGAASHQWHSQSAGGRSCRCSSSRWRLQR